MKTEKAIAEIRVIDGVPHRIQPPWKIKPLDEWAIVGMNHYKVADDQFLYVAMTKDGLCITETGPDNKYLWNRLLNKARGLADQKVAAEALARSAAMLLDQQA